MENTIGKQGYEEEYKQYLQDTRECKETTTETYWRLIKNLPSFNLLKDPNRETIKKMLTTVRNQDQESALHSYIKFRYNFLKQNINWEQEDTDLLDVRAKKNELIGSLQLEKDELESNKEVNYNTVRNHYIRKHHLIEFLKAVGERKARFYLLQYFAGLRFKEMKLLKPSHIRNPGEMGVGENGGVRVEAERSKSKDSRTVEFYSKLPYRLLKEEFEDTGTWIDRQDNEWNDVIFYDLKQSSLNYQLGKKVNGKLYGAFADITGERRTLHSLRHNRITDLVQTGYKVGKIQSRSGHKFTQTTNGYTDLEIENPTLLEDYMKENNIDIMDVIESE